MTPVSRSGGRDPYLCPCVCGVARRCSCSPETPGFYLQNYSHPVNCSACRHVGGFQSFLRRTSRARQEEHRFHTETSGKCGMQMFSEPQSPPACCCHYQNKQLRFCFLTEAWRWHCLQLPDFLLLHAHVVEQTVIRKLLET